MGQGNGESLSPMTFALDFLSCDLPYCCGLSMDSWIELPTPRTRVTQLTFLTT